MLAVHDFGEPRTTITVRGTEPLGRGPSGLHDCFGAAEQLQLRFLGAAVKEVGVRVRVISQGMTTGSNFFHQAGAFTDKFANDEEGGLGVVACEEVEELRSDGGIGAVIESEREFTGRVCLTKGGAEQLRARIDSGVGSECGGARQNCWRGKEKR